MTNTNQTPAPADPHKKFRDLSDLVLKTGPERAQSLQDRILFSWADHVRKPENENTQGKGLGDAIYRAASEYVRTEVYGLTGDLPGNADFKTEVEGLIEAATGLNRKQLDSAYKDKTQVHASALDQVIEISRESMGKKMNQIMGRRLQDLPDSDLEAFKAYLKAEADTMKIQFDAAKVPTMNAAREQYGQMIPLIAQYRGLGERAKAYKQTAEA